MIDWERWPPRISDDWLYWTNLFVLLVAVSGMVGICVAILLSL